jgi:hypothetical protein
MADPVIFPGSGLWHLHSKKDRRWNLQGQYALFSPGATSALMPTEARTAIEELVASLGEQPPDDLRCVTLPYPTPKLRRLFEESLFIGTEKQGAFHVLTQERGFSELSVDLATGEIGFGVPGEGPSHHFQAQFIGLLAQENPWWQWGWVCEDTDSMSPTVLRSARAIRAFGQQQEISELTYAEIGLGCGDDRRWFNAYYLAMIACHVCKADFVVALPDQSGPGATMHWIVTAPGVLPKAQRESVRMGYVIKEAMETWGEALGDGNGRSIVRTYAAQKNCLVAEVGDRRLRIDTPSGDYFFIDFETTGQIYGIELPPTLKQESKKASWFNKLFGRRGGA